MSQITVNYNYAGFTLEIIVDACEAEPQTLEEPGCDAEFIIEEIKLDGKDAWELIGWESWTDTEQEDFGQAVEDHYIDREYGE